MKDKLIDFNTAKLAKEKEFKEPVIEGYTNEGNPFVKDYEKPHCYNVRGLFSAPTQSLLQKWLRENYYINVEVSIHNTKTFWYDISKIDSEEVISIKVIEPIYNTYEEALEAGLIEGLKLIK